MSHPFRDFIPEGETTPGNASGLRVDFVPHSAPEPFLIEQAPDFHPGTTREDELAVFPQRATDAEVEALTAVEIAADEAETAASEASA